MKIRPVLQGLETGAQEANEMMQRPKVINELAQAQESSGALKLIENGTYDYVHSCPSGTRHENTHTNRTGPEHTNRHTDFGEKYSGGYHDDSHTDVTRNEHTDGHTNTCTGKDEE